MLSPLAIEKDNLYFTGVSTLFVKATLSFPSPELLWSFKQQTRAINLHIEPKKNTITGLFSILDIDKAVQHFNAVTIPRP